VGGGHVPYISAITSVADVPVDVGGGQSVLGTSIQELRQTVTEDQILILNRYPFSATRRFEADFGATRLSFKNELREVIVVGDQIVDSRQTNLGAQPSIQIYQGSFALVGDTSNFGFTAPVSGQRYRLEVSPTFGDLTFNSLTLDYRRYFFHRPLTLAFRALHFGRYGTDAESNRLSPLYVGDPTLVRGYEVGDIGLSECTLDPSTPGACPEFDRLIGSRVGVANLELRLPLLGVKGYGLIPASFLPTDLAFFVDAGTAWSKGQSPVLRFDRQTTERVPVVSAGATARILLGGFAVLEFYYAKPFQRPKEGWVTGFTIAPGW
jgi:outer membrane protein assembly factor BamA